MTDVHTKELRSYNMSQIRSKHTKPELLLKKVLQGLHLRYHPKMPGNPDFASKKLKVAVFVDGCFWHKCPKCFKNPVSNQKFWKSKITGNVMRDRKITKMLTRKGWAVLRFWEHDLKKEHSLNKCKRLICRAVLRAKNR